MKLDDLEEEVLGSARRAMRPSLSDAARVRAAVLAQVTAATLEHAAGAKAAGAKAAGGWLGSLGPIQTALVVAAAAGGLGMAAKLYWSGQDAPKHAATSAATVHFVAPTPPPPEPQPAADPTRPIASNSSPGPGLKGRNAAAPPRGPGGARGDRLAEEVRLLRRADRALRSGAPDVAERLLHELAASHPDGQLWEERAAAKTQILCLREGGAAARAAAQKFLAAHPASLYAERIRSACTKDRFESEGTPDSRTRTPVGDTE
jgi:hypothetical protein